MKPYTLFPSVYDTVLKHVDYESWFKYIRNLMLRYVDHPELILELGCGTGRFGAKFSREDYNIIGIDKSFEMLEVAGIRAYKNFRIICADMTRLVFKRKFDFIFSVHDTMNYFTENDEISKVLRSVKEIMHKQSVFLFDLTTEYNIKKYFLNTKSRYKIKDIDLVWENKYDEKAKMIHSFLTFKNGIKTETEEHIQKIFNPIEINKILKEEGFELLGVFGDYTFLPVREDSVMMNFVVKLMHQ